MAGFTNYLEQRLMRLVFAGEAWTPPTYLYVGLLTTMPDDVGSFGQEASGYGYSRKAVWTGGSWAFSTEDDAYVARANLELVFGPCLHPTWGTIVGIGVWDAPTNGTLLMTADAEVHREVTYGDLYIIRHGTIRFGLN